MTNIPVDWRALVARLEGAYSPHTIRAYRADLQRFEEWCAVSACVLAPADPLAVVRFIEDEAERVSASTVRRRLVAISKLHALLEVKDPTYSEWVRLAIRRVKRAKPHRPKQALGLSAQLRDQLMRACPQTLIGLRNRALVSVGYDTLCRRSELVALRVEDFVERGAGGGTVLVRRAKNDPYGRGRVAALSRQSLAVLTDWLTASGIEDGLAFRCVHAGHVGNRGIGPEQVARILKRLASAAGKADVTTKAISGHSMRVGAAQDLAAQGRNLGEIMRAGGWKSINVVGRYIEGADLNIWDQARR